MVEVINGETLRDGVDERLGGQLLQLHTRAHVITHPVLHYVTHRQHLRAQSCMTHCLEARPVSRPYLPLTCCHPFGSQCPQNFHYFIIFISNSHHLPSHLPPLQVHFRAWHGASALVAAVSLTTFGLVNLGTPFAAGEHLPPNLVSAKRVYPQTICAFYEGHGRPLTTPYI